MKQQQTFKPKLQLHLMFTEKKERNPQKHKKCVK